MLATAVRLLDIGAFRIGSEQYAEDNGTFGLATLRREHVHVRGERTFFSYTAKGGIERETEITDRPTATVVRQLLERPADAGEDLLAYRTDDGEWRDVTSDEINAYLKEISDAEITAKDFRTWNATVLMAAPGRDPAAAIRTARKKAVRAAYVRVGAARQHAGGVQGQLRRPAGGRPLRARGDRGRGAAGGGAGRGRPGRPAGPRGGRLPDAAA